MPPEETTQTTQTPQPGTTQPSSQPTQPGTTQPGTQQQQTQQTQQQETPEQKTARETAEKAKADNDTKAKPYAAEELKALIPEGLEVDEAMGKDLASIVNEYGIPRDAVAKLVGLQTRAVQGYSDANTKLWGDTQDEWRGLVAKDAEIGGDKQQGALANVDKVLTKYGADIPTLRQTFDLTGAGNHPDIIKLLARVGKDLAEGGPVSGNPGGQQRSQADILFPNQGKT